MRSQISRWGNSLALRLPKTLAGEAHLFEGTTVEVTVRDGSLVVRPARPKYKLNELLAQEAPSGNAEIDWGEAQGEEEW